MRRVLHDVQRDLAFYQAAVAFRNAVEAMRLRRGTADESESAYWWWGFGDFSANRLRFWPGGDDFDSDDPDDLAGSRVPRRPYGGAGAAGAEVTPPQAEDDVLDIRRVPA